MKLKARQMAKGLVALAAVMMLSGEALCMQRDKPNILIIWGDDIGIDNISAYNLGDGLQDAEHRPHK